MKGPLGLSELGSKIVRGTPFSTSGVVRPVSVRASYSGPLFTLKSQGRSGFVLLKGDDEFARES
jgi:hypothetical protein